MKILLTGASGFLGKSIFSEITNNSNVIYRLCKLSKDYMVDLAKEIPNFKIKFDLVIHAAGKAHKEQVSEIDRKEIYDVNVNGTINLLKGLEKRALPKQFIFISSVSVYGLDYGLNISENHKLLAKDPYGLSKIKAENIIINWCKKNKIICTILRLPLIVGPNPPGNLGAMIKAIKRGYYVNIAGGKTKKSMVFNNDVAKIILKAAKVGGIYNLTDGYHPSFIEISNLISDQLKKSYILNIPIWLAKIISYFGDFIGDRSPINTNKLNKMMSDLTFDDTRARSAFKWSPNPILKVFKINDK